MRTTLELFKSARFLPIFIVQFGGALNDNLFKSAMLIIVAFQLTDAASEASTINNLAALLFILPYFLFSPLAGQLADRSRKAKMMQKNKIAEIFIALTGMVALYLASIPMLLFVLFLLGTQSAMFGPNKYAVLPQLMEGNSLIAANALIASGTFVAILSGTLIGGLLAQREAAWIWIGSGCFDTSCIGYAAARCLPDTPIGAPGLKIDWNPIKQTRLLYGLASQNQRTWTAIMGVSWFWFIGSAYLTQIPTIVRYLVVGDETVVSLFLALFVAGIGLGCLWSARLSNHQSEIGLSPIALLLTGIVGLDLALMPTQNLANLIGAQALIDSAYGLHISMDILLLGLFGGAFVLPLYTELQQSTETQNRARIISINNLMNALFMVISSVFAILFLGLLGAQMSFYLIVIGLINIGFALYLHLKNSARTFRFIAQLASRLIYRIDDQQINTLPKEGPAVIVCNHVSYADPVIIFGACKRPIRFLMDKKIRDISAISWAFKGAGTLPLCSPTEDRKTYANSMKQAIQLLKDGELVFIFPEGRLSQDGAIGHFHRGVEKLLEGQAVPVYPMAIRGLWGSFFSHGGGPALKSAAKLRLFRRRVELRVGDPLPPAEANAALVEQRVIDLDNRA